MATDTKTWAGMADQWVNTWTSVGTQMWQGWAELLDTTNRTSIADLQPGFTAVNQQLADNQQLLTRLLKLSFSYWQDLLPKVTAGENWQQFLTSYSEQIQTQLHEFTSGSLQTNQDTAALWQLYLKQMQQFSQLWTTSMGMAIAPLSQTAVAGAATPWIELNNIYWNLLYDKGAGSLMQSPMLGPSREFNSKLLRSFDAWVMLYRASTDYQILLTNIQVRSFEAFMQELIQRAEKGEAVKDWRQFQQIWGEVADGVFEKSFCLEDNLKIRGKYLNSLNSYRIQQRSLMEVWLKAMDIPVRSEIDEVHQTIYELRKEVKTLKQTLAKYEAKMAVATPPAEPAATTETAPTPPADAATPTAPTTENPANRSSKRGRKAPDA